MLAAVPPGGAVDGAALAVLGLVFAFGTPVLYGTLMALAGCVRRWYSTC